MGRGCVASLRDWAGSESHLLTIVGPSSRLGATRSNTGRVVCAPAVALPGPFSPGLVPLCQGAAHQA